MRLLLFKNPECQRQLARVDYRVREIVQWMSDQAWIMYRDVLVITCIWRGDGTHKAYRAIDIAMLELGDSELLRQRTNEQFPYGLKQDGSEGETIPPLNHGTANHFHVQVCHLTGGLNNGVISQD